VRVHDQTETDAAVPCPLVAEERGAVGSVAVLRGDADRGQLRQHLFEPFALLAEGRVLGVVGGGEMRVDGLDREVLTLCDRRQGPREVVVAETETVHPGVDLQMAAELCAPLRNLSPQYRGPGSGLTPV